MKLLKKNPLVSMFLVFSIMFTAVLTITDENIQKYEHVTITHGDNLWSLANQYSGKMAKQDWIDAVKKENKLAADTIEAGATILVPVEKNSTYVAQQQLKEQTIKVASDN